MINSQLSSDILEQQFGPTTINILHQDDAIRIIQTVVRATGQVLEFSLVRFEAEGTAAFAGIHTQIVAGQSMGKAFRANNIAFQRTELLACRMSVPLKLVTTFGTKDFTVTAVTVRVGPYQIPYATITEIYSGEVKWPHHLGVYTDQTIKDLEVMTHYL